MAATEAALRKSARTRLIVPRGASFFGPPMAPDPLGDLLNVSGPPGTSRSIDRSTDRVVNSRAPNSERNRADVRISVRSRNN